MPLPSGGWNFAPLRPELQTGLKYKLQLCTAARKHFRKQEETVKVGRGLQWGELRGWGVLVCMKSPPHDGALICSLAGHDI